MRFEWLKCFKIYSALEDEEEKPSSSILNKSAEWRRGLRKFWKTGKKHFFTLCLFGQKKALTQSLKDTIVQLSLFPFFGTIKQTKGKQKHVVCPHTFGYIVHSAAVWNVAINKWLMKINQTVSDMCWLGCCEVGTLTFYYHWVISGAFGPAGGAERGLWRPPAGRSGTTHPHL